MIHLGLDYYRVNNRSTYLNGDTGPVTQEVSQQYTTYLTQSSYSYSGMVLFDRAGNSTSVLYPWKHLDVYDELTLRRRKQSNRPSVESGGILLPVSSKFTAMEYAIRLESDWWTPVMYCHGWGTLSMTLNMRQLI